MDAIKRRAPAEEGGKWKEEGAREIEADKDVVRRQRANLPFSGIASRADQEELNALPALTVEK